MMKLICYFLTRNPNKSFIHPDISVCNKNRRQNMIYHGSIPMQCHEKYTGESRANFFKLTEESMEKSPRKLQTNWKPHKASRKISLTESNRGCTHSLTNNAHLGIKSIQNTAGMFTLNYYHFSLPKRRL